MFPFGRGEARGAPKAQYTSFLPAAEGGKGGRGGNFYPCNAGKFLVYYKLFVRSSRASAMEKQAAPGEPGRGVDQR